VDKEKLRNWLYLIGTLICQVGEVADNSESKGEVEVD